MGAESVLDAAWVLDVLSIDDDDVSRMRDEDGLDEVGVLDRPLDVVGVALALDPVVPVLPLVILRSSGWTPFPQPSAAMSPMPAASLTMK